MSIFFEPRDVFLQRDAVDFRKSIVHLGAIVEQKLDRGVLGIFPSKVT